MAHGQLLGVSEELLGPEVSLLMEGILSTRVLVISLISFIIYYLFSPSYRKLELEDVGWFSKADAKNRRQRKLGNIPPVYPNGWFVLLDSNQVKINQVRHVSALGEDFAVFRTESGQVNILNAFCPHLGANLAIGGEVIGNCLECPFHRWQFSGETGECTHVPTVEKAPKAKVKKWISYECNDSIYVWYHAENVDPIWYPKTYEAIKNLSFQGRIEYEINAHIQELFENTSDAAHLSALHEPSSLAGSDLRTFRNGYKFLKNCFNIIWECNPNPRESHIAYFNVEYLILVFGKFKREFGWIKTKGTLEGPGSVCTKLYTPLGPVTIFSCVVPSGPLTCKTTHRLYCPLLLKPFVKLFVFLDIYKMLERDIAVWHYKIFIDKPVLTKSKEDSLLVIYRRWYNQFYSENSPTYEMVKNGLQW